MRRILIYFMILSAFAGCKKDKDIFTKGSPSDFLSSEHYDRMVVELVYVAGMRPTSATVGNIKAFLNQHLNKPAGIDFVEKEIAATGKSVYSVEDIRRIESANRHENNDDRISAFIFFADGDYAGNGQGSKVLGIAYDVSSMAVFAKTVDEFSGGLTQPDRTTVETIVANHEFGHVLGLVNNGVKPVTAHQDEAHGSHCNNSKCLMYYTAETSDLLANLLGNNIPALDENCVNDLRKAGGK